MPARTCDTVGAGTTGAVAPGARPLIAVHAGAPRPALDLREIWNYRDLLYFLAWRDVRVRYKQTSLGATWAIVQPLFSMVVFTLLFHKMAGFPSDNVPYPVFACVALVPWTFFTNALAAGGNSLAGSSYLVTKVYFPRILIPTAAVLACAADSAVASAFLAAMMVYYRTGLHSGLLIAPLFLLLAGTLTFALAIWLAAMNAKYRDIRHAIPFLVQIWMFLTPVIYPSSMVPGKWRWLLLLNPLAAIIEGLRASLFRLPVDWTATALAGAVTLLAAFYSASTFRRMERTFADVI